MLDRVHCGVQHGFRPCYKLIFITKLVQADESIDVNNCVLDGSNISMDSNILFRDGSFEVLSHRYSINNKEVSTFSRSL